MMVLVYHQNPHGDDVSIGVFVALLGQSMDSGGLSRRASRPTYGKGQ